METKRTNSCGTTAPTARLSTVLNMQGVAFPEADVDGRDKATNDEQNGRIETKVEEVLSLLGRMAVCSSSVSRNSMIGIRERYRRASIKTK